MEVYRGDIFFITGSGGKISGSEQKQDRPAVVVSNDKANEHSPVVEVVFLTSVEKARYLPTHVDVMCQIPSVALCEQVNSISKSKLGAYVRTCSDKEMKAIDKALMISLGLTEQPKEQVVATSGMIDDLKMKLEGAERALDEEADKYNKLLSEVEAHRPMLSRSPEEVEHALDLLDSLKKSKPMILPPEEVKGFDEEKICLKTERDLYKSLYEQTLERLIG